MNKQLAFLLLFLLFTAVLSAQTKTKTKTAVSSDAKGLRELLAGAGLPYKMANDSLAAIPFEGENISAYQVVVQKVSDLYIVYTNLSESLPGKINETKYPYLLRQNDHYDLVKIGLSAGDNSFYLRADVYKSAITTALLKRIIMQVANVTNNIAGELKP